MIRTAKFADIPAIVALFQEGHARSKYKDKDRIDVEATKQMLVAAIQRAKVNGLGGTCLFVSETEGAVTGFIMGTLDRVYGVGTKFESIAQYFYCSPGVDPTDPAKLFDAYIGWAEINPKVIHTQAGITDLISDDEMRDRIEILYRRKGLTPEGKFFGMETNHG